MSGLVETRVYGIPYRPEGAALARDQARKALADWGRDDLDDVMQLVVSELVTNAIRHGAPDITLTLCNWDGLVGAKVQDRGDGQPTIAVHGDDAEHGRGMEIVDAVVDQWGVHQTVDGHGGKVVWFTLRDVVPEQRRPA